MRDRLSIDQAAIAAGCSHWTVRSYLYRGVIDGLKDLQGKWWLHRDTPRQIRAHMQAHGAPGGRAMPQP